MSHLECLAALPPVERRGGLRTAIAEDRFAPRGYDVRLWSNNAVNLALDRSFSFGRDGDPVRAAAHFVVDSIAYGIRWWELSGRGHLPLFDARLDRSALAQLLQIAERFILDRDAEDYGAASCAVRAYKAVAGDACYSNNARSNRA